MKNRWTGRWPGLQEARPRLFESFRLSARPELARARVPSPGWASGPVTGPCASSRLRSPAPLYTFLGPAGPAQPSPAELLTSPRRRRPALALTLWSLSSPARDAAGFAGAAERLVPLDGGVAPQMPPQPVPANAQVLCLRPSRREKNTRRRNKTKPNRTQPNQSPKKGNKEWVPAGCAVCLQDERGPELPRFSPQSQRERLGVIVPQSASLSCRGSLL